MVFGGEKMRVPREVPQGNSIPYPKQLDLMILKVFSDLNGSAILRCCNMGELGLPSLLKKPRSLHASPCPGGDLPRKWASAEWQLTFP